MEKTTTKKRGKGIFFFLGFWIAVDLVIGIVLFYYLTHLSRPPYYNVINNNGQITTSLIPAVSENPIISKDIVISWARMAAVESFTFDASNYKTNLDYDIKKYFTPDGGTSFFKALQESGILPQVTSQQLSVTAVVQGQPVILKQGELLGTYTWNVQMPLLLTYEGASGIQTQRVIVTELIVRTPNTISPNGIAIHRFAAQTSV